MVQTYPWYDIVNKTQSLEQGDIIKNCPITIPPSIISADSNNEIIVKIKKYDVIVLTQSCDLVNGKIEIILVCPFWTLTELGEQSEPFKGRKAKNTLRKGFVTGYHLLHKCELPGFETDWLVVDFRKVFGLDYSNLIEISKETENRLRLLPPYRERLSQEFARYFMRVGTPIDIPEFV